MRDHGSYAFSFCLFPFGRPYHFILPLTAVHSLEYVILQYHNMCNLAFATFVIYRIVLSVTSAPFKFTMYASI